MVMEMVRLKMTVEALKPQVCRVRLFEREVVVFNRCDLPINTRYKLMTSAAGHAQPRRACTQCVTHRPGSHPPGVIVVLGICPVST